VVIVAHLADDHQTYNHSRLSRCKSSFTIQWLLNLHFWLHIKPKL